MDSILKGLSVATVILAVIVGVVLADHYGWGIGFFWWAGGMMGGIVLFAFGVAIEHLQNISHNLHVLASHLAPSKPQPRLGNSKADISKLKDFKI